MARRIEFRGICDSLLAKFISRNNDLDGYWALGQFVKALEREPDGTLEIPLTNVDAHDFHPMITPVGEYYSSTLERFMERQGLPQAWLGRGRISLEIVDRGYLRCTVGLISDRGREFGSETKLEIRPHDPTRERRRDPEYWEITSKET